MSVSNTGVYEAIEASVDSGAGVTIMLNEMCTHVPLRETADPRAGTAYRAASGHPVPDMGLERLTRKPHVHRAAV